MMFIQLLNTHRIYKRLAKTLIRLCAGWSELLLVAHTTLLETSCHGSYLVIMDLTLNIQNGVTHETNEHAVFNV